MPKKTYAEQISQAEVMTAGLKNNADRVARRGLDAAFVTKLEADRQAATARNNEQEKLKADLKAKTAQLDATLAELDKGLAEARKIVKLDFPQGQWREFGIEDKR